MEISKGDVTAQRKVVVCFFYGFESARLSSSVGFLFVEPQQTSTLPLTMTTTIGAVAASSAAISPAF
jgi:hypothetical protein